MIQAEVDLNPWPRTIKELKEKVFSSWKKFSRTKLKNLVESFPERLDICINNGGKHTGY